MVQDSYLPDDDDDDLDLRALISAELDEDASPALQAVDEFSDEFLIQTPRKQG
jgi:hypothetical protein